MAPLGLAGMASITFKGIPIELHPQTTRRDQNWIDEAIASGPETPLTRILEIMADPVFTVAAKKAPQQVVDGF